MPPIHSFQLLLSFLLTFNLVCASVTVYYVTGQAPIATGTSTSAGANYTAAAAYDPTVLTPPPIPSPFTTQFTIQLQNGGTSNLSIQQSGSFMGFSIEMSVVNQIGTLLAHTFSSDLLTSVTVGKNSSQLQVPFLNLMANIVERVGSVMVRVGGNTQESAQLVTNTSNGRILEKDKVGTFNPVILLSSSLLSVLNRSLDQYPTVGVHTRASLYVEKCLFVSQRPLVPRYIFLFCLSFQPLTRLIQVSRSSTSLPRHWESQKSAKPFWVTSSSAFKQGTNRTCTRPTAIVHL
jgi:hypothetical protein